MKPTSPTDFGRAVFRDGALDLALAAALLARSCITSLGWIGLLPLLAETLGPVLLYYGLRHWIFAPRAGYVRIREWRSMTPMLVGAYLLVFISLALVFVYRGPIPPGSPMDFSPAEVFLVILAISLFTGRVCLGLRRLLFFGLAAVAALLVTVKGVPASASLAVLAMPPLFMGLWLMRRFLQERRHVEA